jgi:chemotaxis protein histidine kinase CheA/ActR/RegA family two-component response regulator
MMALSWNEFQAGKAEEASAQLDGGTREVGARSMSNTFDKLSVLDSFIEEVNSYLPEIESNLERLIQTPGDMEALEETYRRTHTIGGSASMMDFPGLSHVAHGMEDILGDVLDGIATLDQPTISLLQRSLERMHRLVDGIHKGIDEDAVIAEDDADYAQYRVLIETSARAEAGNAPEAQRGDQFQGSVPSTAAAPSIPSLDEVLASFRTPTAESNEAISWPEEPVPVSSAGIPSKQDSLPHPSPVQEHAQEEPQIPSEPAQPGALELLIASSRQPSSPDAPPVTPRTSLQEAWNQEPTESTGKREVPKLTTPTVPLAANPPERTVLSPIQGEQETSFATAYNQMQEEAQVLEEHASSLKRTLTQLRLAVSVIEAQRAEFRGFLDGSKDALDRMEEWAGKAMGLNLRNSPEQVRRYLPLSVMWVANSKLKKVLQLLVQMTGSVEMTEEQMHTALQQLHTSLETCRDAFEQLQAGSSVPLFTHDAGWTPWEMQVSREGEAPRERVTFERRGDLAALRAEIEEGLREELRQEYESRSLSLAARAELERQIRNEVREEFEARRQLQENVSGSVHQETVQEIEARLRNEIEIEVRREFLSQLTGEVEETASTIFSDQSHPSAFVASAPASAAASPALPASSMLTSLSSTVSPSVVNDFGEEAAELFRQEAEEHLQSISMHVAALENAPTDRAPMQGIRRATHTLKGAAGMMGFRLIADLCHILEDLLDSIIEEAITISPTVLSLILDTTEMLDMLVNGKGSEGEHEIAMQALRARYIELLGEQSTLVNNVEEEIEAAIEDSDASLMEVAAVTGVVASTQPIETDAQSPARSDLSVRVPLQKLDELVNLFGELLVNRSVLEERLQRLMRLVSDAGVSSNRLRDVGQKLESRFEAATLPSGRSVQVMPGQGNQGFAYNGDGNGRISGNRVEPSHLAEFDELELDRYTEFHQLARGLSEGISDMTTLSNEMEAVIRDCESVFGRENRLSTTFQDRLMKARLVPLSTMIPRLYRTARAVALKQHKEFEFVLEGQETEVDRTVIEEIAGPLLHLMRNAVNHAIETPEVRVQKGKPPAGQIKLSAAYEGNQVVITIRDDGTGIDPEKVRNEAMVRGFIRADQALSDSDVVELIFRPGFSTAEVLSEESGRGVGLDVVRDSVSRLRGALEVESMPGQGTAFTMKFPTSLAIQGAMMVLVGEHQFAIPTVMVESIGRLDNFKYSTYGGRPAIAVQNDLYPLNSLAQLLGLPESEQDEKAPVVLVRTDRQRVALLVDTIKGKMDVVMKNLGPHLRHVHGIAGGTVLGNGRVVLVLELSELLSPRSNVTTSTAAVTGAPARRESASAMPTQQVAPPAPISASVPPDRQVAPGETRPPARQSAAPARGKHILVVDDSPSVRRVVGNMLKQHGWEVQVARDGVEALEMITRETPAAILLDIEMPRMDGYELMATVRAQEQYRTLPIVILTSRAATKHQQRAMQLGASGYLVKPYQDEEMLNLLNSLVYGATVQ